jgi:hypothetical protein
MTMLAVDFFQVHCAVTLKRIYVFFALEVGSRYVHLHDHGGTPTDPWRPDQRVRTCSLKPQLNPDSRVLELDRATTPWSSGASTATMSRMWAAGGGNGALRL